MTSTGVEWQEVEGCLMRLGNALSKPTTITLIGSAVCMHLGQPGRMTMDIDCWKRSSTFDLADIKQACSKAGIVFNPSSIDEPGALYLQIVEQGVVQIGEYKPTDAVEMIRVGNLTILRPPLENIVASKMVRGDERDYDDAAYLIAKGALTVGGIDKAITSITDHFAQETARENMSVLALVASFRSAPSLPQESREKNSEPSL